MTSSEEERGSVESVVKRLKEQASMIDESHTLFALRDKCARFALLASSGYSSFSSEE